MEAEGNSVQNAKEEVNYQNNKEVYQGRNISGEYKKIFGNIDLAENAGISHQTVHTAAGRLLEIGQNQSAAKKINGIEGSASPEKLSEDQFHYQQRKQRGENAP